MKTKEEVEAKLKEVKKKFDEYGRKPADVFTNAPRALVQLELETKERMLKWVLQ